MGGVAIVTGGGRGIGRAVALALAGRGHPVCVNDTGVDVAGRQTDDAPAAAVAAEIQAAGGRALAIATDARTSAGAREVVGAAEAWSGEAPAVLVHAAGTLRDAMVHKATDDDWAEVLGSHLGVAVELARAMAASLRRTGYGRIVYVGGAAGLVGSVGQAAYAVAKAGLFGLTRAVALEMAGRDVCVNYVAPFAFTRMTQTIPPVTDQLREYVRDAPAAGPADVAPLVAWLCSPEAGVSGQVFGARGAEVSLWSQPRPVVALVDTGGWTVEALGAARPGLEPALTPLESELDLFGGPPIPVAGRVGVTATFAEEVADADAAHAVGAEYVAAVGKVVTSHVRNELAGATAFDEPAIALARGPKEKWLACRIAMEEYGHHLKFQRLAADLGIRDAGPGRALSVFDYELTSWTEFVVLKALVDLAEVVLMEELLTASYLPLRTLVARLLPEEHFHVAFGKARTRELVADPVAAADVQRAVDDLVRFTVPFFGRSASANNEAFRRWGVKHRTNDEARALWAGRCRQFVEGELGLRFPKVDPHWDG